ncbi:hypothetical protein [Nonomuraea sp. NPDC049784]
MKVATRETMLPGSCRLTAEAVRDMGTTEVDTFQVEIVPDVFRDNFS